MNVRAYGSAKGNATFTYDVNENLVGVDQGKGDEMDRSEVSSYVYDNSGKILAKHHDDGKSAIQDNLDYVYVQGNAVGQTGMSIEAGGVTSVLDSGNYALFKNIDSNYPNAAVTAYTVRDGDTLQSIADAAYGNRSMWYLIAEANNLVGDEGLKAGQVLRIPTSSNSGPINADTHAIYNQDDIIDGTLPNLTSSSSGGGCSVLLQILVVVVAVAVASIAASAIAIASAMTTTAVSTGAVASTGTSLLAGGGGLGITAGTSGGLAAGAAATSWGTTVFAAAVGGAAGSIASQGLAMAVGLQNKFSWKNVGMGVVSGVVTAGVGAYAKTSYLGADLVKNSVMTRAAVSSIATQGLAVATNLQDEFSWRSVGAAALAAGVTSRVGNLRTPDAVANMAKGTVLSDPFAADLIRQTTAGTAGAMAQQWASTGRVDVREAVAGAFGNALGNSLAPSSASTGSDSGHTSDDRRTASLSDPNFADNEYGRLRARMVEYGPDARADFATDDELKVFERAAADNGGVLPRNGDFAPTPDITADDLTMQRVVISGKQALEDMHKYDMRASMPDFGRSAPVRRTRASAPATAIVRLNQQWDQAKNRLVDASHRAGVDPGIVSKIAAFESRFDPTARPIARDASLNRVRQFDGVMAVSSAYGYGQFTNAGWTDTINRYGEKYGIEGAGRLDGAGAAAYRTDADLQADMLAEFKKANVIKGRALGGSSDDANVYALHNLGSGDGPRFLRALANDPTTEVNDVLSRAVVRGNPSLYGDGSITLRDAYGRMGAAMAGGNRFAEEARALLHAKYGH